MADINNTIIGEISNIPITFLNPVINDINQLIQVVQYFGSALILLYVVFMLLRYLESRKTRQIMGDLQKDIKIIKRDLERKKKKR